MANISTLLSSSDKYKAFVVKFSTLKVDIMIDLALLFACDVSHIVCLMGSGCDDKLVISHPFECVSTVVFANVADVH